MVLSLSVRALIWFWGCFCRRNSFLLTSSPSLLILWANLTKREALYRSAAMCTYMCQEHDRDFTNPFWHTSLFKTHDRSIKFLFLTLCFLHFPPQSLANNIPFPTTTTYKIIKWTSSVILFAESPPPQNSSHTRENIHNNSIFLLPRHVCTLLLLLPACGWRNLE